MKTGRVDSTQDLLVAFLVLENIVVKKIKILVADDHKLFRDGLASLLERSGDIECVALAQDGEEAVTLTRELAPDVVLIDVAMPKLDGIETAKLIKSARPRTAVLMLSAYKDDSYVFACMQAGVNGYLLKNMPPDALINAIRTAHAGETVFSHEATSGLLSKLLTAADKTTVGPGGLHSRELQILSLAARGMTNKQISAQLCLSPNTVRTHFANIFKKLGASSRTEAVAYAIKEGLIKAEESI